MQAAESKTDPHFSPGICGVRTRADAKLENTQNFSPMQFWAAGVKCKYVCLWDAVVYYKNVKSRVAALLYMLVVFYC